jgi:2-polyprenyl-6-methoxyphenol hydroxylase-like FAD-dependent oxidoreductase
VKAVIVGGGIAGLAAAVALRRSNVECDVIERAEELREAGAGLALWANGVRALDDLGLKSEALAASSIVNELVSWNDRGKVVDRVDLTTIGRGTESICIPRGELLRILLSAAGGNAVRAGARVSGVEGDAVVLEDGSRVEADFVIAADGARSAIRLKTHPASTLRPAGYVAWRALVEGSFPGLEAGTTLFMTGRGCQAGIFPCGAGKVYWFATRNGLADAALSPESRKRAVLEKVGKWLGPLPGIVEATPAESILENDLSDLKPLSQWGTGRVTFAGDAIHAMTPNLGQGAALALEDAVVLARWIRTGGDAGSVESALRAYELERQTRTRWMATASRRFGAMLQTENALAITVREWMASSRWVHREGARMLERSIGFN